MQECSNQKESARKIKEEESEKAHRLVEKKERKKDASEKVASEFFPDVTGVT